VSQEHSRCASSRNLRISKVGPETRSLRLRKVSFPFKLFSTVSMLICSQASDSHEAFVWHAARLHRDDSHVSSLSKPCCDSLGAGVLVVEGMFMLVKEEDADIIV
jgi:hypothetical protein